MKRVLVVEDDAAVNALLCHVLEEAGFEVWGAVTFPEGRDMLAAWRPDFLVADELLPGDGSGIELTVLATKIGVKSALCTGHPDCIERIKSAGVPYWIKPFRPSEMVETVRRT